MDGVYGSDRSVVDRVLAVVFSRNIIQRSHTEKDRPKNIRRQLPFFLTIPLHLAW